MYYWNNQFLQSQFIKQYSQPFLKVQLIYLQNLAVNIFITISLEAILYFSPTLFSILQSIFSFDYTPPGYLIVRTQNICYFYQLQQYLSNQMKRIITKFDIFPALPTLRAQGQPQVLNLCGGVFSILIISGFLYVFFSILVSTIKLEKIEASEKIQTRDDHTEKVGNITISIGLNGKNLVNLSNIFTVNAGIFDENNNYRAIETFPCTKQFWEKLPDEKYTSLKIDTHVCIQKEGVQIYGGSDTPTFNLLQLFLSQCTNYTGSTITCATQSEIDNFFNTQKMIGRFIPASLLILNTGFSANHQNPLTYSVFQKTLWLLFSEKQQIIGQMFIGTYQINTDVNFLPFQGIQKIQGYFVNQGIISTTVNQNTTDYIIIFFQVSPTHITLDRQYGKIDDILSYVGGLFGIIVSFFAFFMNSFNQYRYELRVSEGAFMFRDGHLARERDLHFGKYLKYALYDWVKMLFCHELKWKDCKAIEEARDEAVEQIDVKYLLKRISQLEKVISLLVKPENQTIASLVESRSIQQVKKRRNIQQYAEKFSDLERSITIENFEQSSNYIMQHLKNQNLNLKINPMQSFTHLQQSIKNNHKKQENKRRENFDNQASSFLIIQEHLKKYEQKFKISISDFDLDQEDLTTEKEIVKLFSLLDEQTRKKILYKIPLGILYRIQLHRKRKITGVGQSFIQTQDQFQASDYIRNINSVDNTLVLKD